MNRINFYVIGFTLIVMNALLLAAFNSKISAVLVCIGLVVVVATFMYGVYEDIKRLKG